MKKLFYFCVISTTISCSINKSLVTYTVQEISKNNKSKITSIINERKLDNSRTLKTYYGVDRGNYNTRAKSFNQEDYNYLREKIKLDSINYESKKELIILERLKSQKKPYDKNRYSALKKESDKLIKFWLDKDIKKFGFNVNSKNEEKTKNNIFEYSFSEPLFTEDNKMALFSVSISKKESNSHEDFLIIMQKKNGKWVFLEKVQSTLLH